MVPNRQVIIKQIQQGKVQAALEGMVLLSGQTRDKDLQQRCVMLQSQLAQLNTQLGLGTLDNASYQLAFNRITKTTLEAAFDLPATAPAYSQTEQSRTSYQSQSTHSSNSGWKTWGILLTGGVVVLIILGVVGMMMEENNNSLNDLNQHSLHPVQPDSDAGPSISQPEVATLNTATPPITATPPSTIHKFVGNWEGVMNLGGMILGGFQIQLQSNNQYVSRMFDPTSGVLLTSDQGRWSATEAGQFVLNAQGGAREVYNTTFQGSNQFLALLIDGSNPEFYGLSIMFTKSY